MRKRTVLSFSVLIAVLLIAVGLWFTASHQNIPSAVVQPQAKVSAEEVVADTLNYIDAQKNSRGFYEYYLHPEIWCRDKSSQKNCPLPPDNTYEEVNQWVILARLAKYAFSGSAEDLKQAEADAENLIAFCQKEISRCKTSFFPLYQLYLKIGGEKYRHFLNGLAYYLLDAPQSGWVMDYGTRARSLALAYEIFKDPRLLQMGKWSLMTGRELVKNGYGGQKQSYNSKNEQCYLDLAALALFKNTDDGAEIEAMSAFYRNFDEKQTFPQLTYLNACADVLLNLSDRSGNGILRQKAESLLSQIVHDRWDGRGRKILWGEGGFLAAPLPSANINTTDAGYTAYLLSQMPQLSFNIVK